jgi:5-methylcytosine-specific restriction enzyme A
MQVGMSRADWHHLYGTKRWKALRLYQLGIEPLCRLCRQREIVRAATVADHVIPHKGDEELFFDRNNLQSLCGDCHTITKARQEHRGYMQGCDARGVPLDPQHPWNAYKARDEGGGR